jgi:hypothetical protein
MHGSPMHTSKDLWALELVAHEDQLLALKTVLEEISCEYYRGPDPPNHLSGEPKCKGSRMLQFAWRSKCFGDKQMYVKFCVGDRFVLLRIHEDYNPNRYEG